jgi:aminomethyltransferase
MKKTSLYNEHINLNAKLVDFAGYQMPIQYKGIIEEHLAVRESCGIFDVSHMGEFIVSGKGATDFLNEVTINDVTKISPWQAQYSAMCYEDGGIIDDILIYKYPEHYMLVVNCSNIEKNFDWILANKPKNINVANISSTIELIAIQGPKSREILSKYSDIDLKNIDYYHFSVASICGYPVTLSRTGYTGELGYEIYADGNAVKNIWNELLSSEREIIPAGLGCRDTLRMEMKYVLYGNDIDEKN